METRREFAKKAFVAPLILTFAVTPSMARAGSNVCEGATSESECSHAEQVAADRDWSYRLVQNTQQGAGYWGFTQPFFQNLVGYLTQLYNNFRYLMGG